MECLIGIKERDFVLLATDIVSARSIVSMKQDHNKMFTWSDKLLTAIHGGDKKWYPAHGIHSEKHTFLQNAKNVNVLKQFKRKVNYLKEIKIRFV